MSDKLWRAVYDRFHKPQTDPEKKKENVERYHAMVKMMAAIERQNLLQIAEDKNLLNNDADLDSFIDGLETALIISMLVEDDTNEFMSSGEIPQGIRKFTLGGERYYRRSVRDGSGRFEAQTGAKRPQCESHKRSHLVGKVRTLPPGAGLG